MHSVRSFALLAAIFFFITGCDSATSPEDFASDYADHLNQVADALQNIKTRDDADAAADNIESLLAGAKSLQEQAQNLTDEGDPSQEVQNRLKAATGRLGSEIIRLKGADLITPRLQSALEQFRSSNEATMKYAKAGALPAPETPLEEAYVEYIHVVEDLADASSRVTDLASVRADLTDFQELGRRRNAALTRIAKAGGQAPPSGAPEKYKNHLQAAMDRARQSDARLNGLPDSQAIAELLRPAIAVPEETITALLANADHPNARPAGPSHVPQTAADGDPALPRIGRPVGPGGVRPGAPGGPRFPGGPAGNTAGSVPAGTRTDVDEKRIDEQRTRFVRENGPENLIEVYLKNCKPFNGPRLTKAVGTIGRAVRAKKMSRVPLQSGDSYLFVRSDKKVQELADAIDLGKVESIDESARKLVLTLDEAKVPQ